MDNHVHLIIDSNGQDISKIMQGISLSHTLYINRVYKRCGHLFQDRFKSEIIDSEEYMVTASVYIHQNPIRVGIVKNVTDYKWSSVNIYLGQKDKYEIIDENYVLSFFSQDKGKAREYYAEYVEKECKIKISEVDKGKYITSDKIGQSFGICGSAVGRNIKKSVEIIIKDNQKKRYFDLILQS